MWKLARKGVVANWLRFVLTGLAVILAVAFIVGTSVMTATINQTFDDLFADIYRGTDAVVRSPDGLKTDFGSLERPPVPASLLRTVEQAPGVDSASGNVQVSYAQIVDKKNEPIGNTGNGAPSFGFGWNTNEKLNRFRLVAGRAPRTDDEIVVDKHTADSGKLQPGMRVRVLTTKPPRTYTLVGIAKFGTADSPAGASVTLFNFPEAQRLANKVGKFDEVSVVAKPGVTQQQLTENIRSTLAAHGLAAKYEAVTGEQVTKENQDAIHEQLGFFGVVLTAFAVIALIVGIFIIYNTFSIVVAQRVREMALLRAVGASRRQVFTEVIGEALVVAIVASLIGAAGGIVIAKGIQGLFSAIGFDFPGNSLVIRSSDLIRAIGVGIVVTLLFAILPARQASRVPPIAAMRDVAFERPPRRGVRLGIGGALFVLGIGALLLGLFGSAGFALVGLGMLGLFAGVFVLGPLYARPLALFLGAPLPRFKGMTGRLAQENAARNPKRTATTAIALVIAVSLVGFITIFAASAKASIAQVIQDQTKVDYFITTGTGFGGVGVSPDLARKVKQLPQFEAVTGLRFGNAEVDGSREQVFAIDPQGAQAMFDFGAIAGSWTNLKVDGLAVSKDKAESHHLKLGDLVPAKFVETGVQPLHVDYIFKERFFGDYYISTATYDKNYRESLDFQVFAKLKPGVTPEEGRKALEPIVKQYPTAKIKDNAQFKADRESSINSVVGLIYGMLALAVFIAFIGIMNTLALSIYERTRELGLLRAVGMTRSQVKSAVRWESVIISIFGSIIGLAIGLFFGWSVVQALHDQGFKKFAAAPGQLVVVVVVAAVLGVGAAILPARRAAKLDVLKAISHE